jgi:hypothetical protein
MHVLYLGYAYGTIENTLNILHFEKKGPQMNILNTGHAYGTIENTLNIQHFEKKGPQMNSHEQFHIYKLSKDNLHLNDTYTDTYNPIFNRITTYYK